jgi:hypothetical protein
MKDKTYQHTFDENGCQCNPLTQTIEEEKKVLKKVYQKITKLLIWKC